MKIQDSKLPEVKIIEPVIFKDDRGYFFESFNQNNFNHLLKANLSFVQDNQSYSKYGVLRGLHYQIKHPQGKLVSCIRGVIYDVIVDLRKSSETFGKWCGVELSRPEVQLWVPPGFAHGFYTRSEIAQVVYKTTDYYYPEYDRTLLWNDLDINWNIVEKPILSEKDKKGKTFEECDKYE